MVLFYFRNGANHASVYTQSKLISENIKWNLKINKKKIRALLVNARNANAFTGKDGFKGLKILAEDLSQALTQKQKIDEEKPIKIEPDEIIFACTGTIGEIFPTENFLPSVGQGIIAAQCRKEDIKTKELLSKINHKETKICAITERAFLKTIGGDCETAVGGNATIEKDLLKLRVQLFSDDGKKVFDLEKKGSTNEPENLGKLVGEEILKSAGKNFKKKI